MKKMTCGIAALTLAAMVMLCACGNKTPGEVGGDPIQREWVYYGFVDDKGLNLIHDDSVDPKIEVNGDRILFTLNGKEHSGGWSVQEGEGYVFTFDHVSKNFKASVSDNELHVFFPTSSGLEIIFREK